MGDFVIKLYKYYLIVKLLFKIERVFLYKI